MKSKPTTALTGISRWYVLGSYANSQADGLKSGLPNEAQLTPIQGVKVRGCSWQPVTQSEVDLLSPSLKFSHSSNCFAYAFTFIHSASTQKIDLLAGSDDGLAVWLNSRRVHFCDTNRPLVPDSDIIPVTLHAGWNSLLLKISQGTGNWGFTMKIRRKTAASGTITPCLHQSGSKANTSIISASPMTAIFNPPVSISATKDDLVLTWHAHLFNNRSKSSGPINVSLRNAHKTVAGATSLHELPAFGSRDIQLTIPAQPVFAMLSGNDSVQFHAESQLGSASSPMEDSPSLPLFFSILSGLTITGRTNQAHVPSLFRGQPAILTIQSARDLARAQQNIATAPIKKEIHISSNETASGLISLTDRIPSSIADPVLHLHFGTAADLELLKRLRFMLEEMQIDSTPCSAIVREGFAALAQKNFSKALKTLQPLRKQLATATPDRSRHSITLVGHAHIDMNWLWNTAETRQVAHDSFRQVLSFMEEFPKFTFSQSQASTYEFIERLDPAMFRAIRRRVQEGRWELLGGMLDEGDTNMSSGEGLVRSLLFGQRYFQSRFQKTARIGWLPDNFGHIAQLPQLLQQAGMFGFYAHRCQPKLGPFVWEGIDGSRVMNYATPTYNGEITPAIRTLPETYDPKNKSLLWVYGVGDHGGGPTRRDITRAIFYNKIPGFPKFEFGTAEKFFSTLQAHAPQYPVYRGELQYAFEGCYTSISLIKEGNRRCENLLYSAELLSALMARHGHSYPRQLLQEAWYRVAFNQFHDILCGSAVHESNRESIAGYDTAFEQASEAYYGALRHLAASVPTATDRGQPVIVFNPHPHSATEIAEVELFSYGAPPSAGIANWGLSTYPDPKSRNLPVTPVDVGQGPRATIKMTNARGQSVAAQIVNGKLFPNGYRLKVRFLARDLPPCGISLYYADPSEVDITADEALTVKGTTMESPLLRVEVDRKTGNISRIFDKRRKKEVLPRGLMANALRIYMEKPHGMSAWTIGEIASVIELKKPELIRVIERGPVRSCIEVWKKWSRSIFVQRIYVYRDLPRIEFELEAHWFELATPSSEAPMLRVAFPVNCTKGRFFCDTPFAIVERPITGQEVPAQKWIDLSSTSEGGAALLNDSKYGFRCVKNVMEMTILRASVDPDPYPDQGPHTIRYALVPHAGDWKAARVTETATAFNMPLSAIETPPGQKGPLSDHTSWLSLQPANVVISSVKLAEDDHSTIIRLAEMNGKTVTATLRLLQKPRKIERVTILEQKLSGVRPVICKGNTIRVPIKPHEVVTLRLY